MMASPTQTHLALALAGAALGLTNPFGMDPPQRYHPIRSYQQGRAKHDKTRAKAKAAKKARKLNLRKGR